uniref:Uncharacterized protein AlNc14C104G6139 n=1 Tax=Albugo laibachii Nc14 TaxID=890382 RepID=F0WHT2_9STRA|nr:conserved hypothetical protein [Albugo laibachii Nc14]|eukprot:CCA20807.1 conserved hypothetical protein [Albugo laibachii Nc14]
MSKCLTKKVPVVGNARPRNSIRIRPTHSIGIYSRCVLMKVSTNARSAAGRNCVTVTRLHWKSHSKDRQVDGEEILGSVKLFCESAAKYSDGIILVIQAFLSDSKVPNGTHGVFEKSVQHLLEKIQREIADMSTVVTIKLIQLAHWGEFVPALNAALTAACDYFPSAQVIVYQSLELCSDTPAVACLFDNFVLEEDLVIGCALPGHTYTRSDVGVLVPLDGCTSPWNTFAMWNLTLLAKIGFPLICEGVKCDRSTAGIEEVATITLFQKLYPLQSNAKLIQLPDAAFTWNVDQWTDESRQKWHDEKMRRKIWRAERQLEHFALDTKGAVLHLPPLLNMEELNAHRM